MTALLERQGEVQEQLDALDAWDLDSRLELAMDALRCPPGDTLDRGALGRRAAPGGAVPAAAAAARHPAARRAHQPPRRRVGGLARAAPAALRGHRHRGHPRPLLPRQRGRLDPRARPRPRHPVEGQLLVVAGAEAGAAAARAEGRERAPEDAGARARVDPDGAQGAPRQGQGPAQRLPAAARRPTGGGGAGPRDLHPAGPAPRRRGDRGRGPDQGLRRPAADRRTSRSRSRRAPSSASSAPTAPARRRCSG